MFIICEEIWIVKKCDLENLEFVKKFRIVKKCDFWHLEFVKQFELWRT
jgi:hypothetical protein